MTYLGYIHVGRHGDVKQIDRMAKMLLYPRLEGLQKEHKKVKQNVFFEIGEIGVKVVDCDSSEVSTFNLSSQGGFLNKLSGTSEAFLHGNIVLCFC